MLKFCEVLFADTRGVEPVADPVSRAAAQQAAGKPKIDEELHNRNLLFRFLGESR